MPSHQTPTGITITSYKEAGDWAALPFGLRQMPIRFGDGSDDSRPIMVLTQFPPNATLPRHNHPAAFCDAVVAGSMWVDDDQVWYPQGTIRHVPAGIDYGPTKSGPDGLTLLEFYETFAGFPAVLDDASLTEEDREEIDRYLAARTGANEEAS
ncbi:MAG TPA: hypothetical protein VKD67_07990 [Acidimicrobiales bacterium]|nr:hypothetical protein [Acidimicrobiales bacterium]